MSSIRKICKESPAKRVLQRESCKESLALLDCFLCESLAMRGFAKEGKDTQLYSQIAVSNGKGRRVQ